MTDQVQCPNCGGYKVDYELMFIDPKTGKRDTGFGYCGFVLLLMISFGLLSAIVSFFTGEDNILPVCVLSIPFIVLFAWRSIKESRSNKSAAKVYKYECRICGYHWQDQSQSRVKVRPDLIEKGEQRLERQRRKE